MKTYQTVILLCFFSMLFYNCSLPADDEEKRGLNLSLIHISEPTRRP